MRNASWTEDEQMKVVWNVVDSGLLHDTSPRTQKRKQEVHRIVDKLLNDSTFSKRLEASDPFNTIEQHVIAWIGFLEGRRPRPPRVKSTV